MKIFADKRIELGKHLRKLPMGFYSEGNIGRISSVLSTDMLFIEENLMMVLADLISYLFSAILFVIFMFGFNVWLGILSLMVSIVMYAIGEAMKNSELHHSDERQRASQELTDAVIEFTEGIGIIKTYNMVGERSKVLTNSFTTSCDKSINFEKTSFSLADSTQHDLCCWNCSHTVGCLIFISSKCNNINLLHWIFILCV